MTPAVRPPSRLDGFLFLLLILTIILFIAWCKGEL